MNVLQNLIELYNHLSGDSTYRNVVKGILLNLEEAADASVYDLAELTHSSRTTIWRMLKLLGYDNYGAFRQALKAAVDKYSFYNRIIPKKAAADEASIAAYVAAQTDACADLLKRDISDHPLAEMARRVAGKEQVFFFFPYRSSAVNSFQQNLAMTGIETCAVCLFPEMQESAEMTGRGTLVFCSVIEHSETMDMTPVFETLHKNKAEVCLFGSPDSYYADCADMLLCTKESTGVLSGFLRVDLYLFALSETFRALYL